MFDVVVRTGAVAMIAGGIWAIILSIRLWLSVSQRTALVTVATAAGGSGIFLLIFPTWIEQPFIVGMWIVFSLIMSSAIWINLKTMLNKVFTYQRMAQKSTDQGDLALAQRYQALADLLVLSLGRLKEVRDISLLPPTEKFG